ncbi:Zinc finger C2HC domain-containing protein 1C [Chytriomyces hyalinus]|nr:Zinc finger C2HC domain-containing protein 1C [Chytriomyces hyalinus]
MYTAMATQHTSEFTSQPVKSRPKTCHICGHGVPGQMMALHQNKCIRRNISCNSLGGSPSNLVTMDGSSSPRTYSTPSNNNNTTIRVGAGFKNTAPASIVKRSLSDIPMPVAIYNSSQAVNTRTASTGQPKQPHKRIPLPSPSNRVAAAAELFSVLNTSIQTSIPVSTTSIRFQRPEFGNAQRPTGNPLAQAGAKEYVSGNSFKATSLPLASKNGGRVAAAAAAAAAVPSSQRNVQDYVDYSEPSAKYPVHTPPPIRGYAGSAGSRETGEKPRASYESSKYQKQPHLESGPIQSGRNKNQIQEEQSDRDEEEDDEEEDGGGGDTERGGFKKESGGYMGEIDENDEMGGLNEERMPCPLCKRKFAGEERLEKHVTACSKQKTRKVFDATKARVKGTELEQYVLKKAIEGSGARKGKDQEKPIKAKKQNWRVKHDNFIRMVRANRQTDENGVKAPIPPSEPDPDYVQCDHCGRRFNETAAERHIPICANTKNRPRPAAAKAGSLGAIVAEDEARMRKRLDFKPPAPKVKKSPEKKR